MATTWQPPVIVSTHPRTRKQLEALSGYKSDPLLKFMKPFGYLDYVKLQQHAKCVLSDCGTISEESAILSIPAISIRNSMERPEAQDTGTIILSGFEPDIVLGAIHSVGEEFKFKKNYSSIPQDYQIADTSWRVLKLIIGNAKLSNKWWRVNEKEA